LIGQSLAHYEILSLIGKGGMGEVYHARDTKLGREVAIKLLPREVASDPERLARFRREAKLLAALNHPSIGALYGIEETDEHVFLVMELAEGEDLSKRLQLGPLAVDEALAVALQIAESLEAAHAKNIVHRDLKPANVMYSPSGRVKLLDFGLARAYHGEEASGDPMMSPTITAAMTQQGMVLGTAAYMSPEQARGKSVDRQSDIWAFGVLLYEMLTAHRVFEGETVSDSIGAILHKDPEWPRLPAETPPQVRQLLVRCLERDRDARLHDIADARAALLDARRDPTGSRVGLSGITPAGGSGRRVGIVGTITAILGIAIGGLGGVGLLSPEASAPYRVLDLGVAFEPEGRQNDGIQATVAPDGSAVVYTHAGALWVQNLDEYEPRMLEQTEDAFAPFWSPDGSEIGWFQNGRLWKAPARGGRPVALCEVRGQIAGGLGAHWGDDGRILFALGSTGIQAVSERGGQVRELVEPGEGYGDLHEPFALPEDKGVLFVSHPEQRGPSVLELWNEGQRTVLFEAGVGDRLWSPNYDPDGYVLFRWTRGEATEGLWAIAFDAGAGQARGEPFLVEPDASEATIARDGTMVFVMNPRRSNQKIVVRVGFAGDRREALTPAHEGDMDFALSPDGRSIAFTALPPDGGDQMQLWVRDLGRGTEVQLTTIENRMILFPQWTADGQQISVISPRMDAPEVQTMITPADGSRPWSALADRPVQITPDGEHLLVLTGPRGEPLLSAVPDTTEIWLRRVDDPESGRRVLGGTGVLYTSAFSPSGNLLLYYTQQGGLSSAYLTRYPAFTGRWRVSLGEDVQAEAFAPDGSAIYYTTEDELYRVPLEDGPNPVLGRPELVGTLPTGADGVIEIHPEGDSYLIAISDESQQAAAGRRGVKVVQNWTAKLER
jgi:serine/threonine protein kinase